MGEITEVSRTGVFIETNEIPRSGAVVALQFWTPTGDLVDLRGEVRWNTHGLVLPEHDTGFAVLLSEPPAEFREFYLWAQEELEKPDDDEP